MTVGGKDVLINCGDGVVDKYEVEPMRPYQGFQLLQACFLWIFSLEEESMILCPKDIVDIIGGLPLAIEVIASYLYGNKVQIQIWREALDK